MDDQPLETVKVHNPEIPGTFMIVNAVDAGDYQLFEEPQGETQGKQKGSKKAESTESNGEPTETQEAEEPKIDVTELKRRLKNATEG